MASVANTVQLGAIALFVAIGSPRGLNRREMPIEIPDGIRFQPIYEQLPLFKGEAMRQIQLAVLFTLISLAGGATAQAQCPPWRPCGPGNSWGGNRFIHQGFYSADFRAACAGHDACYQTCTNRRDCDRQFLYNMQSACNCSSNPRACYRKAHMYYTAARLFGGIYRQ